MQWTPELDALLNQCAFSSGYDFAGTCAALKPRAARLRLDSDALTPAACEAQWMLLNPVVEEDGLDGLELDPAEDADPCDWMLEGLAGDTTPSKLGSTDRLRSFSCCHEGMDDGTTQEQQSAGICSVCSPCDDTPASTRLDDEGGVGAEGAPRLELSISEAELDELLRDLPARSDQMGADGKDAKSEMQWVLAFLTDPEATARTDAEAKQFAVSASAGDIRDDDNYKGFLKELGDANLLVSSPKKIQPVAAARNASQWTSEDAARHDGSNDQPHSDADGDSDSDSDTEEWISTRRLIKQRSGCDS